MKLDWNSSGLKGRVPVEQLDDERLTNIERGIVMGAADAAARGRAPRFNFAAAFAVTAVVAIGAGFAGWVLRGDGSTTVTNTTVVAAEPVRVNTSAEQSTLDIGDARIVSDPATELTVTRPDGGVLVTMKRGKIELDVDKRGDRAPLVVAAGDTRVIVIGTRFSVDFGDGSGPVDVRVTEGVVKVERLDEAVRVAANQAWTSSKRGVVALADLPEKSGPLNTIEDAARNDEQIDIATDTPDVLKDRKSNVPDAKIPTTGVHHGTDVKKPTKPEINVRPQQGSGSAASARMDLRRDVLAQDVLPPLDLGPVCPDDKGSLGACRPEQSIGKYRQIVVEKKGDEASLAFYSIAAMQHQKLGRNGDALRTLDAYVRRFVGGKEYKAALWLRVRILCTKAVDDRCRQAAYTFMHQATGTPAAKVAEMLTLAPR